MPRHASSAYPRHAVWGGDPAKRVVLLPGGLPILRRLQLYCLLLLPPLMLLLLLRDTAYDRGGTVKLPASATALIHGDPPILVDAAVRVRPLPMPTGP